ncbi:synaptogyrin-2-like [Salarias fasciatus]|uniref:Synaptogyrin-2-like n=1 Tax=Salarias fasciatus TaxID=181472 RepID=A0A672I415_SALFA|nr:synaptogyrin-2-like [Salarias fasciatus]XP_029970211.1 synaptogyrin-2-like [Salarias fasciatus]XP_029970212.1 synaptogyrin-2-like [Salarias fasciatus]
MQSGAHGFDPGSSIKHPQTVLRSLLWAFSVAVLTIGASSLVNVKCVFIQTCSLTMGVGILTFLGCVVVLLLDVFFLKISNAKVRKYIVTGNLIFTGFWTVLWFICFCFLLNLWENQFHYPRWYRRNDDEHHPVLGFSFFSILSWSVLFCFAYQHYREEVTDFNQEHIDKCRPCTITCVPQPGQTGEPQPPSDSQA